MDENKEIFIVDRVEGNFAICEDEKMHMIDINLEYINGNVREGCIIIKKNNMYLVDDILTKKREEEIENLTKGLWDE